MADLLCYMALLVTPPGLDHRELQATRPATPMGKLKLNRTDSERCRRQGLHEAPHVNSLSRGWEEEQSEDGAAPARPRASQLSLPRWRLLPTSLL